MRRMVDALVSTLGSRAGGGVFLRFGPFERQSLPLQRVGLPPPVLQRLEDILRLRGCSHRVLERPWATDVLHVKDMRFQPK